MSLLTAAIAYPDYRLVTGDRKSISALVAQGDRGYITGLRGRILCLERLILNLSEELGLKYVRDAVLMCHKADRAIPICVGLHSVQTITDFKSCMKGYLTETDPDGLLDL